MHSRQWLSRSRCSLLHSSAEAQTKAIGNLQAAELKHTAFYERLQKAHQAAMALNANPSTEDMDDDSSVATPPGEDPMKATRQ